MKLRKFIIIIIVLVVAAACLGFSLKLSGKVVQPSSSNSGKEKVLVTKDNFYRFIEENEVVMSLSKDAVLNVKFYNFNTGVRQWDASYVITKGSMKEGYDSNADADIIIASKYAAYLASDFCGTMKKAKEAGDLGLELKKGKAGLLWKYRGVMQYKSCLGM